MNGVRGVEAPSMITDEWLGARDGAAYLLGTAKPRSWRVTLMFVEQCIPSKRGAN